MGKYIEQIGDKEEIIKSNPNNLINSLNNAKTEVQIDKNKYQILEYTIDYMNNLLKTIEKVNNCWNSLLNISISYQDEINYKKEVNYNGVNNSVEYIEKKEPEKINGIVNTTSDYLNMRNTPNGNIVSSIPPGTKVEILENDIDGWTKVKVDNLEAYVCSRYITLDSPLEVINTKTVTIPILNIRNYPNGNIISTLPHNSNVQILANSHNGWTKILFDGKIAYINSNDIN